MLTTLVRLWRLFFSRDNPLFFEQDGDFNPGWALFMAFSVVGLLASAAIMVVAYTNPKVAYVAIAALSFIAFAMLCTAIIVVPIARAKLLAPALPEAVKAISAVTPPYPGMDVREGDPGDTALR